LHENSRCPQESRYRRKSIKRVPTEERIGTPGSLIYCVQRQPFPR
jgi:hypothetical protein